MAAMNKQIKQERRGFFWTHADCKSCSLYRFVPTLSQDSRASFASFRPCFDSDIQVIGPAYLQPFFRALPNCVNFTYLDLDLALDELFWNAFSDACNFLKSKRPLSSANLDSLVQVLSNTSRLERILIRVQASPFPVTVPRMGSKPTSRTPDGTQRYYGRRS